MTTIYDDEQTEHECPRPLTDQVDNFDSGGMFLSPAGRWETITDLSPVREYSARVQVHTDRTGPDYCWQFWGRDKFPYVPSWLTGQPRHLVVFEFGTHICVEVTDSPRSWGHGYSLIDARQVRGSGWQVSDCPDGKTPETVTVASKARARSEVNRRARVHAKRLDIPLWREPAALAA